MMRIRHLSTVLITGALLATTAMTSGCGAPPPGERKGGIRARMVLWDRERSVPIQNGPVTLGRFLGVDATNNAGGVFVEVHDRYDEAKVRFRVRHINLLRQLARAEGWDEEIFRGPWFTAEYDRGSQTGVLRIRPTDLTLPDGSRPLLDVFVYAPACDGVTIENTHGDVEIVGARGEIDVLSTGRVEVRSDDPLVENLNLRSTGDGVLVVAAPESRGTFLITAPQGRATFTSRYGTARSVSSERSRWNGVWNDGPNTVTLQADNGHARYIVKENAELYTPTFQ
ncbi:MAG: hypothetical protein RIB60_09080 [Phycisphaerales bacterium]